MGIRMTIQDTDAVTTEDLLSQLPHSKFAKEVRTLRELEKQYAERLGRLAQLCDTVIPWVIGPVTDGVEMPHDVRTAIGEIMDYVDAVRP